MNRMLALVQVGTGAGAGTGTGAETKRRPVVTTGCKERQERAVAAGEFRHSLSYAR